MMNERSKKNKCRWIFALLFLLVFFQSAEKADAKIKNAFFYNYFSGVKESSGIYKMRIKDNKLVVWGNLTKIKKENGKIISNLDYKKRSFPLAKNVQLPTSKANFKKQCKKGFGGCVISIEIKNGKVINIGVG